MRTQKSIEETAKRIFNRELENSVSTYKTMAINCALWIMEQDPEFDPLKPVEEEDINNVSNE